MIRIPIYIRVLILLLVMLGIAKTGVVFAAGEIPTTRQTTIVLSYTEHEWWLISWIDNAILCRVLIDHEGLPTEEDIWIDCGNGLLAAWQDTPPCIQAIIENDDENTCKGLYLQFISSQPKQRELIIDLPLITVFATLEGCTPIPPENRCGMLPSLLLTGIEPLPNESITKIQGLYEGLPFDCEGKSCAIPLKATRLEGATVEFWADSSFGDSSQHYNALVRVIDSGVPNVPGSGGWFVDVLSSQWRGGPLASCSQTWNAFPPIGGMPGWLATPEQTELIASDEAYYYLAGRLISQGVVDASECPSKGLLSNGYADTCGLETAKPFVELWQNQFDQRILEVATQNDVPAQLMKNLFAQESQFWPGLFRVPYEFGLGQITDNGADVILLWDATFFDQFCPLVLSSDACSQGYLHLAQEDQAILRGALALQAKSDCIECLAGIDLTNVDFSLALFANSLKANCEQVSQIIYNATKEPAGAVSDYEDLWRFTIANYHAGPGCLSYAIHMAWYSTGNLTWEEVSKQFTDPCLGVVPYVEKITGYLSLDQGAD